MSGMYPDTPEGSEVDVLEYANETAERLFYLAFTGQIADRPYVRWARWLDSIPGAGEYYRALVQDHPLHEVALMRYGAFLAGQAAREHTEEQQKNEGAYHQKKQKSKRHGS